MPVNWSYPEGKLQIGGAGNRRKIDVEDAQRQEATAKSLLADLAARPGVILADEVGMGKTYVALAVAASVILSGGTKSGPVVVMVPGRLRSKWQRDWGQFVVNCDSTGALAKVRHESVTTPTELFKLLDDKGPMKNRCQLVFLTTGCFQQGLRDPWIKLAMIRLARSRTKLTNEMKRRLVRWMPDLLRQVSQRDFDEQLVEKLLHTDVHDWKRHLVARGLLTADADDPVPELLSKVEPAIDWSELIALMRDGLPQKSSPRIGERLKESRERFRAAFEAVYKQWIAFAPWHAPLLILDEAHHTKNDSTKLAKLFRQEGDDAVRTLGNKFDRMLFLTATPFQLGHQELINVLRSFGAVRWSGPNAPAGNSESFSRSMDELSKLMDRNREAGRRLDEAWGRLSPINLSGMQVDGWWWQVELGPRDDAQQRLFEVVQSYRDSQRQAQEQLRPWVLRHNRPRHLPQVDGASAKLRREELDGRAILRENDLPANQPIGLPISADATLPFLLTAAAQGHMARAVNSRAFFAEGLASSYEAFHHTRDARGAAEGDGDTKAAEEQRELPDTIVPVTWYEENIAALIPARPKPTDKSDGTSETHAERMKHPKLQSTVNEAIRLWSGGEKVLVFCRYRETSKALYEHLSREVQSRIVDDTRRKLGFEPQIPATQIEEWLQRTSRRFSGKDRPFRKAVWSMLERLFESEQYAPLLPHRKRLKKVLAAYFRSPAFISRYLPLEDPKVRSAFEIGESSATVLQPALAALEHAVHKHVDQSNQSFFNRAQHFLDFALDLAERSQVSDHHRESTSTLGSDADTAEDEAEVDVVDPLWDFLQAVAHCSTNSDESPQGDAALVLQGNSDEHAEHDDDEEEPDDGTYRIVPLVRVVNGATAQATRDRVVKAFNSPLFPEILVASSVMSEGVDLHRFCRHVIHHDGCWNPSTLEQQTGRLDRLRCKAEVCRLPIQVYNPFVAGGADEKMFRVLRDRQRWFQIIMGQKFEFDEAASESLASRVPLPASLAEELAFDLARWRPPTVRLAAGTEGPRSHPSVPQNDPGMP